MRVLMKSFFLPLRLLRRLSRTLRSGKSRTVFGAAVYGWAVSASRRRLKLLWLWPKPLPCGERRSVFSALLWSGTEQQNRIRPETEKRKQNNENF